MGRAGSRTEVFRHVWQWDGDRGMYVVRGKLKVKRVKKQDCVNIGLHTLDDITMDKVPLGAATN